MVSKRQERVREVLFCHFERSGAPKSALRELMKG